LLNAEEKNLGQFYKKLSFYPKNFQYALKYMGLGSGIRKKPIPDPGSRGQKGTGSRIRIPTTVKIYFFLKIKGFSHVTPGSGSNNSN
jgi:hypothetical protein